MQLTTLTRRKNADVTRVRTLRTPLPGKGEVLMVFVPRKQDNPLINAVRANRSDLVADILESGDVDTNEASSAADRTALHYAAKTGNSDIVSRLLDHVSTEIDPCDEHNQTPLHLACRAGHNKVVKLLVEAKADVTARSKLPHRSNLRLQKTPRLWTPLHYASYFGHDEVALTLLSDKRTRYELQEDEERRTPLYYAVKKNHIKVVTILARAYCKRKEVIKKAMKWTTEETRTFRIRRGMGLAQPRNVQSLKNLLEMHLIDLGKLLDIITFHERPFGFDFDRRSGKIIGFSPSEEKSRAHRLGVRPGWRILSVNAVDWRKSEGNSSLEQLLRKCTFPACVVFDKTQEKFDPDRTASIEEEPEGEQGGDESGDEVHNEVKRSELELPTPVMISRNSSLNTEVSGSDVIFPDTTFLHRKALSLDGVPGADVDSGAPFRLPDASPASPVGHIKVPSMSRSLLSAASAAGSEKNGGFSPRALLLAASSGVNSGAPGVRGHQRRASAQPGDIRPKQQLHQRRASAQPGDIRPKQQFVKRAGSLPPSSEPGGGGGAERGHMKNMSAAEEAMHGRLLDIVPDLNHQSYDMNIARDAISSALSINGSRAGGGLKERRKSHMAWAKIHPSVVAGAVKKKKRHSMPVQKSVVPAPSEGAPRESVSYVSPLVEKNAETPAAVVPAISDDTDLDSSKLLNTLTDCHVNLTHRDIDSGTIKNDLPPWANTQQVSYGKSTLEVDEKTGLYSGYWNDGKPPVKITETDDGGVQDCIDIGSVEVASPHNSQPADSPDKVPTST